MTWFSRGAASLRVGSSVNSQRRVYRFRIVEGSKRIMFVDGGNPETEPFLFNEHWVPGVKPYFFTCSGSKCKFCEVGYPMSLKGAYTIYDIDGFVGKDGRKRTFIKRLWVVSKKLVSQINAFNEKYKGGIRGKWFEVQRVGRSDYVFIPIDEDDDFDISKVDMTPLNYEELLKPLSYEEQTELLLKYKPYKLEEVANTEEEDEEDDVPF